MSKDDGSHLILGVGGWGGNLPASQVAGWVTQCATPGRDKGKMTSFHKAR